MLRVLLAVSPLARFREYYRMACRALDPERRGMTISVVVLGVALFVVMMAYMAFGDSNDEADIATLRLAGVVCNLRRVSER